MGALDLNHRPPPVKTPSYADAFSSGAPPSPPPTFADQLAELNRLKFVSSVPKPRMIDLLNHGGQVYPGHNGIDQANFTGPPIRDDPGNSVFSGIADYANVFPVKQYPPQQNVGKRGKMGDAFEG